MKILIASDFYIPTVNGVVTSIINLKSGLEELGHEVRILTLSMSIRTHKTGNVYYLGSFDGQKIYPDARFRVGCKKREIAGIIKWKPDIIHTQNEFSTYFIARKISKRLSVPMVDTYHTMYEDYTHYFFKSKLIGRTAVVLCSKLLGRSVDCIVTPTQKIHYVLDSYELACPIYTIPTGLSLEHFEEEASNETIEQLKESLGIPEGNKVLVSVSRISKEKNIYELIHYMKGLKDKNISFVIVGDGPEKAKVVKLIQKLGLSEMVILTGMVRPHKVPLYYQMADIFVSASTSETQGLTYIESLASGTPILCRKDDCLDGVLEEGDNGYSFVNEYEFLSKLDYFMTQANQQEMSVCARKTAEKYSKENFVQNIAQLYETILESTNKLPPHRVSPYKEY